MNDITPDTQAIVICHCSGTTREKIMVLIDGGCVTLEHISRKTGAYSGCGSCEYSIVELLAEYG